MVKKKLVILLVAGVFWGFSFCGCNTIRKAYNGGSNLFQTVKGWFPGKKPLTPQQEKQIGELADLCLELKKKMQKEGYTAKDVDKLTEEEQDHYLLCKQVLDHLFTDDFIYNPENAQFLALQTSMLSPLDIQIATYLLKGNLEEEQIATEFALSIGAYDKVTNAIIRIQEEAVRAFHERRPVEGDMSIEISSAGLLE